MKEIAELINKFEKFIDAEITSAVKELEKISEEKNRKHLQKLVYTNLINRFDVLVDNLLLVFSTREESDFKGMVLDKVKETGVSAKDFYEILLSKNSRDVAIEKVEDIARLNYLRDRHSRKLRILLRYCFACEERDLDRPRVNVGDGRIHDVYNKKHQSIPRSVVGYADYLYSRRNVLVHGDGSNSEMLDIDKKYMKKNFNVTPVKYVGIKISSINTAATFYKYLCRFMATGEWAGKRGF